ncbi:MAG: hypothetical protein A2591_04110 [Candidatus Yonathbacteria bacterium RIFOXYD1_FULL_52_36]|uniref:VWFA domain-containing protein n=1 Tax=Candidatus Yonathbacteria bacterium RIFOXYD1_FULL_52_36 TaxID=1802730 RepID=A0A1G2SJG1_9BACT|nr:MAG: hypothetical protein A2591_04110 [Candidatus Yonathbacteria bacterium RIFOXYD1_FULL_52_36]
MMTWSLKRQILYGAGALFALVLVLAYPAYLVFHNEPTCMDNNQNGTEEGVDCGGVCARACTDLVAPLSVEWATYFNVGGGMYDVAASIENKNAGAGIADLPYRFILYNESGAKITEREGRTFANPREEVVVFEPKLMTNGKVPAKVELVLGSTPEWLQASVAEEKITVRDKVFSGKDAKPKVTATLENTSPNEIRNVEAIAVVYDGRGNAVGVSSTFIERIKGDGTFPASFFWPLPFVAKRTTDVCTAPVDVMLVFDRSGSMVGKPLTDAKAAAQLFVERLSSEDQVGLVTFATDVSDPIDSTLSFSHGSVRDAIGKIAIGTGLQYTNLGAGIEAAGKEFTSSRAREGVKHVIVALTDGVATMPENPKNKQDKVYPETFAALRAEEVKKTDTLIYAIGLGREVNVPFLKGSIASSPDHYYAAATSADLGRIYGEIIEAVCKEEVFTTKIFPRIQEVGA